MIAFCDKAFCHPHIIVYCGFCADHGCYPLSLSLVSLTCSGILSYKITESPGPTLASGLAVGAHAGLAVAFRARAARKAEAETKPAEKKYAARPQRWSLRNSNHLVSFVMLVMIVITAITVTKVQQSEWY